MCRILLLEPQLPPRFHVIRIITRAIVSANNSHLLPQIVIASQMNAKIERLVAKLFVDESHKGSKFSVTLITFITLS